MNTSVPQSVLCLSSPTRLDIRHIGRKQDIISHLVTSGTLIARVKTGTSD